jgi:hypothetical protein
MMCEPSSLCSLRVALGSGARRLPFRISTDCEIALYRWVKPMAQIPIRMGEPSALSLPLFSYTVSYIETPKKREKFE